MIQNSFFQKVFLTVFWGLCAAGLIQYYRYFIFNANEEINGEKAQKELYGNARQVVHPVRKP